MRELRESEVTFTIEVLPEEIPVRGNALASGDDDADHDCENKILRALERGNGWAWCCVRVTAAWSALDGEEYTGCDSLGCCSYAGEKDFTRGGGYFDDMKREALDNLNKQIEHAEKRYAALCAALGDK